jgi:hypothetical protein
MPTSGWLRRTDLPQDAGGRSYIDPPNLDQILDQFINWRGDVNAGGWRIVNFSMSPASIEVGAGIAGDHASWIDLIGDNTYTDWGLRVIRNAGAGGGSNILSAGAGLFTIGTFNTGQLSFVQSNAERLAINSNSTHIMASGALPSAAGNWNAPLRLYCHSGNGDELVAWIRRDVTGSDWTSAYWSLQRIVDGNTTVGAAVEFGPHNKLRFRVSNVVTVNFNPDNVEFRDPTNGAAADAKYAAVQFIQRSDVASYGSMLSFIRGAAKLGCGVLYNDPWCIGFGPAVTTQLFTPNYLHFYLNINETGIGTPLRLEPAGGIGGILNFFDASGGGKWQIDNASDALRIHRAVGAVSHIQIWNEMDMVNGIAFWFRSPDGSRRIALQAYDNSNWRIYSASLGNVMNIGTAAGDVTFAYTLRANGRATLASGGRIESGTPNGNIGDDWTCVVANYTNASGQKGMIVANMWASGDSTGRTLTVGTLNQALTGVPYREHFAVYGVGHIVMPVLPASASGLPAGGLWRDGSGYVRIV